jgi:hypothetical protein
MTNYNSLVMVANQALGGGSSSGKSPPPKTSDPDVKDLAAGHGDIHSAVNALNMAMRF